MLDNDETKPDMNYILLNGSQATGFIYELSSQLDKNTDEEINYVKFLNISLAKNQRIWSSY